MAILISLQRDLGGVASRLQSCRSPEEFPKTVVFCKTKPICVKVHDLLSQTASVKSMVSMYHATLSDQTKRFLHQQFASHASDLRCLVCTVAFGMVSYNVCLLSYCVTSNSLCVGNGCT